MPTLVVDVTDLGRSVEVGVENAYEIRVKNEGITPLHGDQSGPHL